MTEKVEDKGIGREIAITIAVVVSGLFFGLMLLGAIAHPATVQTQCDFSPYGGTSTCNTTWGAK